VFMNLLSNAADATGGTGSITIIERLYPSACELLSRFMSLPEYEHDVVSAGRLEGFLYRCGPVDLRHQPVGRNTGGHSRHDVRRVLRPRIV